MKVTPEKVGVAMPLTASEREFAHLWAGEWNVELTEGFKALSKEVETTTAPKGAFFMGENESDNT